MNCTSLTRETALTSHYSLILHEASLQLCKYLKGLQKYGLMRKTCEWVLFCFCLNYACSYLAN